ncbi:MAG: phosphatidylglycerol lysyltransferase domain-containing protein [Acidobacteriota bacterium]|nr:phosphatidylglycerol lysyltransferase domain-containing protein [Acidobacteriota bacterium]
MNLHSFLGFEFSAIRLDDLNILTDFLRRYPQPLSGYTFSTLAAWHPFFHYGWTFAEPETLLISCALDTDIYPRLLQPIGLFSPELAQKLLKSAMDLPYPLKINGVSDRFLQANPDFVKYFAVQEDRAGSNYLYRASDLASLAGRKYAKKRNLLSQASNLYAWSIQNLTQALTDACFYVLDTILKEERPKMEKMLAREWSALECTLRHFDLFNQRGLVVSVEGRAVAFSIYEAISPTTIAVHFERALRSYKGLYQVVNWETAKVVDSQGFEFINREEDLGDPGLRKAKMSYNPLEIVPAFELTYKK